MLETISTVLSLGAGVMLGLFIFAYAVYITFFPLAMTMLGGLQVLKRKNTRV